MYDLWEEDYQELYPQGNPMPNPIAPYTNLNPLDPYWNVDRYVQEILEIPYPYGKPTPQYPETIPAPLTSMSEEMCGNSVLLDRS
ncbi:hypothetical protein Hanom_Chr06g00555581 [Helianthus anomalus]